MNSALTSYPLGFLITMQKELLSANQSFSLLDALVYIITFEVILIQMGGIQKFFSRFWFCLQSKFSLVHSKVICAESKNQDSEPSNQLGCFDKNDESNVCREDVEMVMKRLGLFCSSESEELKDSMSSDELSQLFDEKEPSLEEVKEAFNVFDQNRDGFIDAKELQRVLCKLGLKEGYELESCRKMIRTFDENGDGRIDFNEFVKFMENNFC